jgi:hypothetical protein
MEKITYCGLSKSVLLIIHYLESESRKIRWEGHTARMEKIRKTYEIIVGRPERKRQFER